MHVVTHLLVGWTVATHTAKSSRDRALITWASVVPDIDGLGLLADWAGGAFNSVGWLLRAVPPRTAPRPSRSDRVHAPLCLLRPGQGVHRVVGFCLLSPAPRRGSTGIAGQRPQRLPAHLLFLTRVRRAIRNSPELSGVIAEADMVAARVLHRTRVRPHVFVSRVGDVTVTGEQALEWRAIVQFRLQDGRIAEEWVMRDELGMLLQLGKFSTGS